VMKHLTSNHPNHHAHLPRLQWGISISTESITAFALGILPPFLRSIRTSPNHVPKTGRSASLATVQTQSQGLPSSPCPVSSIPRSRINTRESCIFDVFRTIICPKFVNSNSTRWKQCVPIRRISSGNSRSHLHVLLIISKNIELNKRSHRRSTRRRIRLLGGVHKTPLNTRSINNVWAEIV
jgi:hypothetical protein